MLITATSPMAKPNSQSHQPTLFALSVSSMSSSVPLGHWPTAVTISLSSCHCLGFICLSRANNMAIGMAITAMISNVWRWLLAASALVPPDE